MDTTTQSDQSTPSPALDVDLDALADLVWELLEADVRVEQERIGNRGTGHR